MKAKSIFLAWCLLFGFPVTAAWSLPTPPAEPLCGPGGADYKHAGMNTGRYDSGDLEYWLFEPASPVPQSAPVVVFNHGWGAMNPAVYGQWIEHIVRKGNIVIYPRYQASLKTKPVAFTLNASQCTKNALTRLRTERGHVRPKLNMLAALGHSAGGQIAASMAALAAPYGLPPIGAVMCVEPAKSWGPKRMQIPLEDLRMMPAATLLLTVCGDRDTIARDIDALRILRESVNVPLKNKNFVTLVSDEHGLPPLIANHYCPIAPKWQSASQIDGQPANSKDNAAGSLRVQIRERIRKRMSAKSLPATTASKSSVDALDYYGIWKLFDALEDAAFFGRNRQYALGNTPEQRFMGKWSDGVAVKELIVH